MVPNVTVSLRLLASEPADFPVYVSYFPLSLSLYIYIYIKREIVMICYSEFTGRYSYI